MIHNNQIERCISLGTANFLGVLALMESKRQGRDDGTFEANPTIVDPKFYELTDDIHRLSEQLRTMLSKLQ